MASLQAVIFDLWNTLIADPPEAGHRREELRLAGLRRALTSHGLSYSGDDVERAYRSLLEEMAARQARGRDLSLERRVMYFLSKLAPEAAKSPALAADAAEAFVAAAGELPPPVQPGALEAVRALREAGLRVGLISNTGPSPGRGLRHVLRGHGLLRYFDVLTFSDEVGLCKPAPRIYRRTLEALGVGPSATAFVGDDPELDVAGPMRAGMWTVQVSERSLDGVRPHARIGRLDELLEGLQSLGLLADS